MSMDQPFHTNSVNFSENIYEQAVVRLLQSSNSLQGKLQKYLTPFNLTIQQFNILRILKDVSEPVSLCKIKEMMIYKMPDTSRLVKRLADKGLLHRHSCCNDKRLIDIALTERGRALVSEVDQLLPHYTTSLFSTLSDEECRQLCRLLDKVSK